MTVTEKKLKELVGKVLTDYRNHIFKTEHDSNTFSLRYQDPQSARFLQSLEDMLVERHCNRIK